MRILYIDIDSLRPDHLGCYGYHRNTSPNIDALAKDAAIFNNCYASDVPCLPSRTALFWSQFGYRTQVVNHGGQASQMNFPNRGFHVKDLHLSMPYVLARQGLHTCTISPFIDRHSAWHVLHGFREYHDNGHHGHETADETNRLAIPWLKQNARKENWFLHLNYWDPHIPYRTPESYGNPFQNDPPPSWLTQEIIDRQLKDYGPRSASCPRFFPYIPHPRPITPREVDAIRNRDDFKIWIDGYDTGIHYADYHIGQVIQSLRDEGVLDDTLIIISADHGEAQGEINTYGEHLMVDHSTARVPLIIRKPGLTRGTRHDQLLYQFDFGATLCELAGARIPTDWDSQSFLPTLKGENQTGRPYLVLSQGSHTCMRSVRTENWLMMRTYHPGTKPFPEVQLYDIASDPHETRDLTTQKPEVIQKCTALLQEWTQQFSLPPNPCPDPFITVLTEGGPYHARTHIQPYIAYLRKNGQMKEAEEMARRNLFEKPFQEI